VNCPICKSGNMTSGHTSMTFERAGATVVVKGVPADICDNCGEAFVADEVARRVHEVARTELRKGVEIEVIHYAA
jgi:YgiT-type zinc finger domain-containing protein